MMTDELLRIACTIISSQILANRGASGSSLLMSCITVYIITVYIWSYWCPVSLSTSLQYTVDPIDVMYHCLHYNSIQLVLLMSCITVYIITVYSWSYWCHVSLSTSLQYIVGPIDVMYHCLHYYRIYLIILMSCITVYIITVYSWSYWCPVSQDFFVDGRWILRRSWSIFKFHIENSLK
jgi:hypothetical protein